MTTSLSHRLSHRIAHLHAASRIGIAIVASAATALLVHGRLPEPEVAVAAWDGFAVVALGLTWTTILTLKPVQICTLAQREDPSRLASLVLVLLGSAASLLAVFTLLQAAAGMHGSAKYEATMLAVSAVALAWFLIHTVFTLRYAHVYYDAQGNEKAIEWPGSDDLPDYLDFAYFAFVIGMTAQTADVNIRSRRVRRTALAHGVVAFAFNTAVVALSISVLSSLITPAPGK